MSDLRHVWRRGLPPQTLRRTKVRHYRVRVFYRDRKRNKRWERRWLSVRPVPWISP